MQGPVQLDEVEEADYVEINANDATSNPPTPLSITKSSSNSTLELNPLEENLNTVLSELSLVENKDEVAIQTGPEENLNAGLSEPSQVEKKDEFAIQSGPEETNSEEDSDAQDYLDTSSLSGFFQSALQEFLNEIKDTATEVRDLFYLKTKRDAAHGAKHVLTGAALEVAVEEMESSSKPDTYKRQAAEAIIDLTGRTLINAGVKELYRVETDVKVAAAAEATREAAVILQKATKPGMLTSFKSSLENEHPELEPQAAPKSKKKKKGKKLK